MSRDDHKNPSASRHQGGDDWVQEQLSALRATLDAGEWPEAADELLREITATTAGGSEEEDADMLSLVINDALDGVDISRRYPNFYRRLLADLDLRQAFLDALAILEPEDLSDWEAFPKSPVIKMGFLEEEVQQPLVEVAKEGWRIIWQRSVLQLEQILGVSSEADTGLAWRGARANALEEESLPLLRDSALIGEQQVEVFLEATRPPGPGRQLEPTVIVISAEVEQPLQAILRWGSYEATAAVGPDGFAHLPVLPLAAIFDETGLRALSLEIMTV